MPLNSCLLFIDKYILFARGNSSPISSPEKNDRRRNKTGPLEEKSALRKIKGRTMEKPIIDNSIPEKSIKCFFMRSRREVAI